MEGTGNKKNGKTNGEGHPGQDEQRKTERPSEPKVMEPEAVPEEPTELVQRGGQAVASTEARGERSESGTLLQTAISRGAGIEELKLLMDLRDREERWKAEREFELRFAEMQKDYVAAIKKKEVRTNAGQLAYHSCPLPEILLVYTPILTKHGFSYRWDEKPLENGERRTTCYLSGYGHTRSAYVDLPIADQNQMANKIQVRGITREYGRRYSFMDVTGCIVADEQDTDGVMPPQSVEAARKQVAVHLPYLPGGMRDEFKAKMEAGNAEELNTLAKNAAALRERCQKIVKTAEKKGGAEAKQKVMTGFKNVKNTDNLCDWEAYCEGL